MIQTGVVSTIACAAFAVARRELQSAGMSDRSSAPPGETSTLVSMPSTGCATCRQPASHHRLQFLEIARRQSIGLLRRRLALRRSNCQCSGSVPKLPTKGLATRVRSEAAARSQCLRCNWPSDVLALRAAMNAARRSPVGERAAASSRFRRAARQQDVQRTTPRAPRAASDARPLRLPSMSA